MRALRNRQTWAKRGLWLLAVLTVYGISAYLIAPAIWHTEISRHPGLHGAPRLTHTAAGIPGDPLHIALVATEPELVKAMLAAGWHPADPLTLETSLRIAASTVFRRPYVDAPVSSLYLWGRKRIWRSSSRWAMTRYDGIMDASGARPRGTTPMRPLWMGAASYDARVGFSHTAGQITHHIAPDVDAEREKVMQDLQRAGQLGQVSWIDHFHQVLTGHNGGGDAYYTDGRLAVGSIVSR